MRIPPHVIFAFVCVLSACGSMPSATSAHKRFNPEVDPYWLDPHWDLALLDAVQSVVHAPANINDLSAPGLHGTVKFIFAEGDISYPEIVESTGDQEMDKLMLHQVVTAHPPKPTGPYATTAHEFSMPLDMPTPLEIFQSSLYAAIDYQKIYPKEAIMAADVGNTTVGFDYQDGEASGIAMVQSSNSRRLDQASLSALARATFPPTPPSYAGKPLHMEVVFCYSLISVIDGPPVIKNECPTARNVIMVRGTRIKRTTIETVPATRG